ncbi:hypothetical protein [Methanobacterium aggregans]|uniref:hypothetical protein n=1 Tax=Methanobacterium aggregans TaxID=1615586 RepID=UPI001AEAB6EA|nr:hypothetical protein [Methanobacterium aggregans]MBP2045836.1 hypothetical protein [Methanobacterium aggregans]
MRKLFYIAGILVILLLGSVAVNMYLSHDSLEDFNGPGYIPPNYQLSGNNTTENSTFLLYQGSSQLDLFIVGATKDPDKKVIKSIKSSFNNTTTQSANLIIVKENMTVDDHPVELDREEININGVLIDLFETKWYCDKSKLTITATGIVPASEMGEIRKMLKSIKCHRDTFF